ncbi:MAG: hypothetical protein K2I49_01520, partial [Ureaplasma sp.]|nr:hypothetical protein [Ureaplasma sp.]
YIYIASDPDREGEGIAWHVYNKINKSNQWKIKRITFNEISSPAINYAIKHPKQIDINYVNSYLARIALDKKIGYGLSKFLQQTKNLPSAGRVQSIVLKLVKEREDEIEHFIPKTTYYFEPIINDDIVLSHFETENDDSLFTGDEEKLNFATLEETQDYQNKYLNKNEFELIEIGDKEYKKSYPSKPFKTSTIQAKLIDKLSITSKEAEKILQELYQLGLITYPRTDSTRISEVFCEQAYNFVKEKFPDLASNEFQFNNKNSKGAQDAHEAIRVVHLEDLNPNNLDHNQLETYKLIYENTIIQFMKPCETEQTTFKFKNNLDYFKCNSEIVINLGFNSYLNKDKKDRIINFELNNIYEASNFQNLIKSKTTKPPKPFTQSTLIKELEKLGIGRPSTYASSVEINNIREYTSVNKDEIVATTDKGRDANQSLLDKWDELINYEFTASMEKELDLIADGKSNYKNYLNDFLDVFETKLYSFISLKSNKKSESQKMSVIGKCPYCQSDIVEKELSNGSKIQQCIKRKYDVATKTTSGCKYYKFI